MGILTDGRILCTLGPFKATDNDASITDKIFDSTTPSLKSFIPQDVMIVDRGFRDCVTNLMNRGFVVQMPVCSHQSQLTTIEANKSRLVTKVRYNVERVNGVMKSVWKIFFNTIDTHYIPKIMTDFEIGAVLINRKSKTTVDDEKSIEFANEMHRRVNMNNVLSTIVKRKDFENLMKKKRYEQFIDFIICPKLQRSDLEMIAFESYQLKQSYCYISNHLYEDDKDLHIYKLLDEDVYNLCGEIIQPEMEPLLLLMQLKSRFISQKVYQVLVLFDIKGIGHQSVLQYCCSCKVGNRTVGCCSHVMSLLFYISYSPNFADIKEFSSHLKNVFEQNYWMDENEESANDDDDSDDNEA